MQPKPQSALGIAGMVVGIISVVLSCIIVGSFLGIIGFFLSFFGLFSRGTKRGAAIAGLILNLIAMAIPFLGLSLALAG